MPAGPKNKYKSHVEPKLNIIAAWAKSGLTIEQIAKNLKVAKSTFCTYMNKHPELLVALKENRDEADYAIENALYKKALEGDNTAMIFWLKNRQSAKWRDRQEIDNNVKFSLGDMTAEQAEDLIRQFMKGE
jgi:IS30 family transposase